MTLTKEQREEFNYISTMLENIKDKAEDLMNDLEMLRRTFI